MATYIMYGKYRLQGLEGMSTARTADAVALIKKHGGKVEAMYATLGVNDLVFILSFPGDPEAMRASVAISRRTGITFQTAPAVSVDEFDKLIEHI